MDFKTILEDIKKWCEKESILYLEGSLTKESNVFKINSDYTLFDFLILGKNSGASNVIIESQIFNFEDTKEGIIDMFVETDTEYISKVELELIKFEKYNQQLSNLSLYWTISGVIYQMDFEATWFNRLSKKIEELIDKYEEFKWNEKQNKFPNDEEQFSRLCDEIASNSDFLKFSTRPQKINQIIEEVLLKEKIELNNENLRSVKHYLKPEVNRVFEKKYRKKAERGLKLAIKEMLDSNCSKIELLSKLDIPESFYHKFK